MNVKRIYSVYDNKAKCYLAIHLEESDVVATRHFHTAAKDPNSQISQYPEDFDLYYLGDYDPVSGFIASNPEPQFVIGASTLLSNEVK